MAVSPGEHRALMSELEHLISEERNLHDGPATGIVVEDARETQAEAPAAARTARPSRAHAA